MNNQIIEVEANSHVIGPAVSLSVSVSKSVDYMFTKMTEEKGLDSILTGDRFIPAVDKTVILDGPEWGKAGARRYVHFKGGGRVTEQLVKTTPPQNSKPCGFTYQISDFQNTPLKFFILKGQGEFQLTSGDGGTLINWTYSFQPKFAFSQLLIAGFLFLIYKPFMIKSLNNVTKL